VEIGLDKMGGEAERGTLPFRFHQILGRSSETEEGNFRGALEMQRGEEDWSGQKGGEGRGGERRREATKGCKRRK
jgi:hypothetical protein